MLYNVERISSTSLTVIWHLQHLSQGARHLSLHGLGTSVREPRLNDRRRGPPLILGAVHLVHVVHAVGEKPWHGQKYVLGTAALRSPTHAVDLLPPLLDQSARLAAVHCEAVAQLAPRNAPALPAGRRQRLGHTCVSSGLGGEKYFHCIFLDCIQHIGLAARIARNSEWMNGWNNGTSARRGERRGKLVAT
jgi:hypothetical protein